MSTTDKKEPVNNLNTRGLEFCCGMTELGNFNYVDPPGGKKMSHYHKIGGWRLQENNPGNTLTQIKAAMARGGAGIMASTGAGQEYVEPILAELGWKHVFTFRNPSHADTPVKVWCYSKFEVKGG